MATREQKQWEHHNAAKLSRQISGAVSAPRKTPQPDKVRRKDWGEFYQEEDPDAYYDLDIANYERVMPEGETEWRQAKVIRSPLHSGIGVKQAAGRLADLAAEPDTAPAPAAGQGTVVEISSSLCTVAANGSSYLCTLRKSLRIEHSGYSNMVAVGDEVIFTPDGGQRGVVNAVLPRRSALSRPDPFNTYRQQVIVANVDQALIVASWREPAFWPELVDRYLIAAQRHNLAPTLCINKVDLASERDAITLDATASAYRAAGYAVLLTSAVQGAGIAALAAFLQGKTTALAGLSGVGKSSLLSAAEPGLNLRVSEVSERRHEGRHTTTQVTLHPLRGGGFVADTPGIREVGLAGQKQAALARFYPEFARAGACAYANCSHTREPACAVKGAVRAGQISRIRYESYVKIWRDLGQ